MSWDWQWPSPGPSPINQSMDTEIFDGDKVPLSETVVREAIQNSLDARIQGSTEPARVRFRFHQSMIGHQIPFLDSAMAYREVAEFPPNDDWRNGNVNWLTIEDFGTTGLLGSVERRTDDFWNYWLNFGLSNKSDNTRGGRGIGRVTFLIASKINTVLGLTRRSTDQQELGCGMTVLKADQYDGEFRSTHAYLAADASDAVYKLHNENEFTKSLIEAFRLRSDQIPDSDSGLSLVIPYPHDSLTEEGILASALEHFGPAILSDKLIVEVGGNLLNHETLPSIARSCSQYFKSNALKDDPNRYVSLLNASVNGRSNETLKLAKTHRNELATLRDDKAVHKLAELMSNDDVVSFEILFPLARKSTPCETSIKASMSLTPRNQPSIDMLFRDGMYLPEVATRSKRGYDLMLLVTDPKLSDYLNLCEGKAHLDLLETVEVKQKLKANGYTVAAKRLIKALPEGLRKMFLPDITEPDATVFGGFFSVPESEGIRTPPKPPGGPKVPIPEILSPTKRISPFKVTEISSGLKVSANAENKSWPVSMRMTVAYADGTRKPKWNYLDFDLASMKCNVQDCENYWFKDNIVLAQSCGPEFVFEIAGFDVNRELDIRVHKARTPESA
jgi:hypothetical protein